MSYIRANATASRDVAKRVEAFRGNTVFSPRRGVFPRVPGKPPEARLHLPKTTTSRTGSHSRPGEKAEADRRRATVRERGP